MSVSISVGNDPFGLEGQEGVRSCVFISKITADLPIRKKKKKHVLGKEFHYSLLRFIIQREFEHVVFSPTGFQTTNQ
jgi:hypothetical protein